MYFLQKTQKNTPSNTKKSGQKRLFQTKKI